MNAERPTTWGETVKARMRAKALRGVPTGPVPLGYRKVHDMGTVRVEIDEAVAPLVREAFRLAALKRNSLRDVLREVTEQGLVSQRGTPLHPSGLWRILTNPFYIGIMIYGGEEIQGTHQALISCKDFANVQKSVGHEG
ncbi:MAG: recombinase family protein [Janthinobacterium lividum]